MRGPALHNTRSTTLPTSFSSMRMFVLSKSRWIVHWLTPVLVSASMSKGQRVKPGRRGSFLCLLFHTLSRLFLMMRASFFSTVTMEAREAARSEQKEQNERERERKKITQSAKKRNRISKISPQNLRFYSLSFLFFSFPYFLFFFYFGF